MKIEFVGINTIKLNPNNPRIIKDDKFKNLVNSIKAFPKMLEIRPIVVNDDMIVLGGNMRLRASQEAGLKEIPIIKAEHLTPEDQKQFIIRDNIAHGEWDWSMLANDWDNEELKEWGLEVPEFKDAESVENETVEDKTQFIIAIECKDEAEQQMFYDEFISREIKCKLIM